MKKQAKAYPGGKEAKIHNPSGRGVLLSLGLPERKSMASKKANAKKKGGSKKRKRNPETASAKSSAPKKGNPKKKGGAKRSGSRRNPLPSLGSVSAVEWGAFALAAIASRAITSLITNPDSWAGIGLQIGLTIVSGKFAPKGVRTAVTFGAGGGAVVSVVNRLTNNAIQTTITNYLGRFVPQQQLQGGGMAGLPIRGPGLRRVNGQNVYR